MLINKILQEREKAMKDLEKFVDIFIEILKFITGIAVYIALILLCCAAIKYIWVHLL